MKNVFSIALLVSVNSILLAGCGCSHTPKDHINTQDAGRVARTVTRETPARMADDVKNGVRQTAQNVKEDFDDAADEVRNSKTYQSGKEAYKCMCDKSKCLAHNAKEKGQEALDSTKKIANQAGQYTKEKGQEALDSGKKLANQAGQFTKEMSSKASNTLKETAYKVVNDVAEGAMELKGDFERAKERAKRS